MPATELLALSSSMLTLRAPQVIPWLPWLNPRGAKGGISVVSHLSFVGSTTRSSCQKLPPAGAGICRDFDNHLFIFC